MREFLQKAVMVNQDGAIGPLTLMAVAEVDPEEIINRLAVYRDAFIGLCRPSRPLVEDDTQERRAREQALEMARG